MISQTATHNMVASTSRLRGACRTTTVAYAFGALPGIGDGSECHRHVAFLFPPLFLGSAILGEIADGLEIPGLFCPTFGGDNLVQRLFPRLPRHDVDALAWHTTHTHGTLSYVYTGCTPDGTKNTTTTTHTHTHTEY